MHQSLTLSILTQNSEKLNQSIHGQKRRRLVASCQFCRLRHFHEVATGNFKAKALQFVATTCTKPVDWTFWQLTCNKSMDNLQQACRQQAVAGHATAF